MVVPCHITFKFTYFFGSQKFQIMFVLSIWWFYGVLYINVIVKYDLHHMNSFPIIWQVLLYNINFFINVIIKITYCFFSRYLKPRLASTMMLKFI